MINVLFLIVLVFCALSKAEGPRYRHTEPEKQLEFENVYQDLRSVRITSSTLPSGSTQYIQNGTSEQLNANFNISTGTMKQLNVQNSKSDGIYGIVENTNNSAAGAYAKLWLRNGGSSGGDPIIHWNIAGIVSHYAGIDNSDSDIFKRSIDSEDFSSGVYEKVNSAGEINLPLQPSFLARVNNTISDVTGDNTNYTVIFDSEIYDQGADFNLATSVFTAPVTGRYLLTVALRQTGLLSTHTAIAMHITTSNRMYDFLENFGTNPFTGHSMGFSVIADMDSGDTATAQIQTSNGTKVVDVGGSSGETTLFSGSLIN